MKATVFAKDLKDAVTWTSKVIGKPLLPILDCVMLSVEEGKITVRATNLSVDLTRTVEATVSEPGRVAVNTKSLRNYLGKVKSKNTTVSLESYIDESTKTKLPWLALEANAIRVTLPTQDPSDYPLGLSNATWHDSFVFDPEAVNLKQIAKFADHLDTTRIVLKCVLAEVCKESYKLTTADGFRLVSTNAIPLDVHPIASEANASYLLPAKAAELMHSLKSKGVLAFGSRKFENGPTVDYAQFTTDDSAVTSRLEEGQFPDYNQIIPTSDRGIWAIFNTEELANTLAPFKAMTSRGGNYHYSRPSNFSLSSGKLTLSATSEDGDQIESSIAVDWTGEELAIGLDASYVLDCLALCGDKAEIMFEDSSRPITVKGNGCLMVVMPMHIKG